ncbi:hypothetical protein M885DRAFT_588696 [Pelagophyceae sp. CCMP2097]|nr:hypothetical protein M885DRAFT_588696 [Pelagophyceae sp. CCMP2097]
MAALRCGEAPPHEQLRRFTYRGTSVHGVHEERRLHDAEADAHVKSMIAASPLARQLVGVLALRPLPATARKYRLGLSAWHAIRRRHRNVAAEATVDLEDDRAVNVLSPKPRSLAAEPPKAPSAAPKLSAKQVEMLRLLFDEIARTMHQTTCTDSKSRPKPRANGETAADVKRRTKTHAHVEDNALPVVPMRPHDASGHAAAAPMLDARDTLAADALHAADVDERTTEQPSRKDKVKYRHRAFKPADAVDVCVEGLVAKAWDVIVAKLGLGAGCVHIDFAAFCEMHLRCCDLRSEYRLFLTESMAPEFFVREYDW